MKLLSFIFLLLFWPNISKSQMSTCPFEVTVSTNVETIPLALPGSNLLLYGLNLFEFEAYPKNISNAFEDMVDKLKLSRGVTEQLFEMTCSKLKRTWIMPNENLRPHIPSTFIVPDFVESQELNQHSYKETDIVFENSVTEIITSMKGQVTFETDLKFLGGSSSSLSYEKKINTTIKDQKKIVELRKAKATHSVNTYEYAAMRKFVTPKFVKSWRDLPKEYNEKLYELFMKTFGTHFFDKTTIGSYHYKKIETNKEYTFRYSEDIYKAISTLRILDKKFSTESSLITTERYEDFVENSKVIDGYVTSGGMKSNDESEWMDKWPTHPWIISGRVYPVHDLIDNKDRRDNMRLALAVMQVKYFLKAYEKDINDLIESYGDRIKYEGQYKSDGIFLRPYDDGMYPAVYGCEDEIDKSVNEMICCFGQGKYSVKEFKEAHVAIQTFYKSPTLKPNSLNDVEINSDIIQKGLYDLKFKCYNAKREDS